jgi:hypothetical protein
VTLKSTLANAVTEYVPPSTGTTSGMLDAEMYRSSAAICVIVTVALFVPAVTVTVPVRSLLSLFDWTLISAVQIWPFEPELLTPPTVIQLSLDVNVG